MERTLITVIVLTYRNFDNLRKNLESIYNQDYENIEIIISDDGSENFNRLEIDKIIMDKTANVKSVVIIENKQNLGTVKNFNNAIKKARGEYIFPLAQDDIFFDRTVIARIMKEFKEQDLNIVSVKRMLADTSNKSFKILPWKSLQKDSDLEEMYISLLTSQNFISGASTYYKKSIFDKHGFFDESYKLLEDFPFYLKILLNGEKIKFLDIIGIKYFNNGVSGKKTRNLDLLKDFCRLYKQHSSINKGYLKRILNFYEYEIEYEIKKNKKINLNFKYFDVLTLRFLGKIIKRNILKEISKFGYMK